MQNDGTYFKLNIDNLSHISSPLNDQQKITQIIPDIITHYERALTTQANAAIAKQAELGASMELLRSRLLTVESASQQNPFNLAELDGELFLKDAEIQTTVYAYEQRFAGMAAALQARQKAIEYLTQALASKYNEPDAKLLKTLANCSQDAMGTYIKPVDTTSPGIYPPTQNGTSENNKIYNIQKPLIIPTSDETSHSAFSSLFTNIVSSFKTTVNAVAAQVQELLTTTEGQRELDETASVITAILSAQAAQIERKKALLSPYEERRTAAQLNQTTLRKEIDIADFAMRIRDASDSAIEAYSYQIKQAIEDTLEVYNKQDGTKKLVELSGTIPLKDKSEGLDGEGEGASCQPQVVTYHKEEEPRHAACSKVSFGDPVSPKFGLDAVDLGGYRCHYGDKVDEALGEWLNRRGDGFLPSMFVRLDEGVYLLGTAEVNLYIRGGTGELVARVEEVDGISMDELCNAALEESEILR